MAAFDNGVQAPYALRVIFLLAFGSLGFGALLILLIARYSPREASGAATMITSGGRAIPYDEFRALLIDILDALKFDIVHITGSAEEIDIIARSSEPLKGGRFIVHGLWAPPGDVVPPTEVLRLQESVRAEGAAKGIMFTPYVISTDGLGPMDGDMELVDGRKLRKLAEDYSPAWTDKLVKFRGFGLDGR